MLESTARGELPSDVLAAGVKRLASVTLGFSVALGAVLTIVAYAATHDEVLKEQVMPAASRCLLPAMALNMIMWVISKQTSISAHTRLRVSLIYLVLFSFALSALRHALPWTSGEILRSWSPVALLLIIYGALVPARPADILTAAVFSAAMDPLTLQLLQSSGQRPDLLQTLLLALSPATGAAVAYLCSKLLYGLTERISKAREVGSYQLEYQLGVGGMGEVWRARHQLLARPAAIKLIRPQVLASHGIEESRRLLRLFEREAQTTANLNSPHTIHLYDFGVTLDGTFFYVMELLDGFDLQTLVKEFGPQSSERVAHLLIQACDSLHEAHEHHLVHRDLKPANLFACRYGGHLDFVKVLDFGLVMDRRPTAEELEQKGLIGTPAVMAPEMVRFNAPVDQRADIYALGCVGYWLLTGQRVFDAESRADMLVMHAHQRPVPPARRSSMPISEEFSELIVQCLAKNPDHRPQTALEMGDAIAALDLHTKWSRQRQAEWWQVRSPTAGANPNPPRPRRPSSFPPAHGADPGQASSQA